MSETKGTSKPVNDNSSAPAATGDDGTTAFACEECEVLRIFTQQRLHDLFGDLHQHDLLAIVGKEIIGCEKERKGLYNRCRLYFYPTIRTRIARANEGRSPACRASLGNRDIAVAGCKVCRNIRSIPPDLLNKLDIHEPLTKLIPHLKCKWCKQKDAFIAIVQRPY